jgi:hypothetical protein
MRRLKQAVTILIVMQMFNLSHNLTANTQYDFFIQDVALSLLDVKVTKNKKRGIKKLRIKSF